MSRLTIHREHLAARLAQACFGAVPRVRAPRARSLQPPEVQQAKLKAAREKRHRKYLKHVQEGH
jgi:hypothetical protein